MFMIVNLIGILTVEPQLAVVFLDTVHLITTSIKTMENRTTNTVIRCNTNTTQCPEPGLPCKQAATTPEQQASILVTYLITCVCMICPGGQAGRVKKREDDGDAADNLESCLVIEISKLAGLGADVSSQVFTLLCYLDHDKESCQGDADEN